MHGTRGPTVDPLVVGIVLCAVAVLVAGLAGCTSADDPFRVSNAAGADAVAVRVVEVGGEVLVDIRLGPGDSAPLDVDLSEGCRRVRTTAERYPTDVLDGPDQLCAGRWWRIDHARFDG